MQEVTCFHCRTVVQIAPDDDYCSNCGEDLRGLLRPDQVSAYFCERVAELAASGQASVALAEAERGLTYYNIAELHLLAAMLAEGLGQFDVMRAHVAAIPLGDSLRAEAEWLLRAHQDRQRALREGAKHGQSDAHYKASSPLLADLLGEQPQKPQPSHKSTQMWTAAAAMLVVALLFLTWFARGQKSVGVSMESQTPQQAVSNEAASASVSDGQTGAITGSDLPVDAEAAAGAESSVALDNDTGEAESAAPQVDVLPTEAAEIERLLPIPTPSVPDDLVLPAPENEAIVDSNPRSVVVLSADGFDLQRVLREAGYPDLAELPIDARLQDGKLVLNGLIHLDRQRRQILEVLEAVPGITEVSSANLLLRPSGTYIVQPGDTLWSIVYDIYGNVDNVEEFYLANLDVAPSPDAIRVGDELRIPPDQ
jgi:nucleoid-associated protein YgaU